jgi:hypothetical protein
MHSPLPCWFEMPSVAVAVLCVSVVTTMLRRQLVDRGTTYGLTNAAAFQ